MIKSLFRVCPNAHIFVLCLDRTCYDVIKFYCRPFATPISLLEIESYFPALPLLQRNRSKLDYYFTMTPHIIEYAMCRCQSSVTYLDADLYFYNCPSPLFDEVSGFEIGLVSHRFPDHQKHRLIYGEYNVSWVYFAYSEIGISAVRWWAERCREWCSDIPLDGLYADQKYLEGIREMYQSQTKVLEYAGINLAEYNIQNHILSLCESTPYCDNVPVIFWHVHCIFRGPCGKYYTSMPSNIWESHVVRRVYRDYTKKLADLTDRLLLSSSLSLGSTLRYDFDNLLKQNALKLITH